jgi:HD-GYP domain-containing protein (c-di-GMP phosphodiesterase class II)
MSKKIQCGSLEIGMFVAELDRPWIDTPFLIEGFLIEDNAQIVALRAHCDWVLIDPSRSLGAAYEAPPKPEAPVPLARGANEAKLVTITKTAPVDDKTVTRTITRIKTPSAKALEGGGANSKADPFTNAKNVGEFAIPISSSTGDYRSSTLPVSTSDTPENRPPSSISNEGKTGGFWGSLKSTLRGLLPGASSAPTGGEQLGDGIKLVSGDFAEPRPAFVPETMVLVVYEDAKTVEEETPIAHASYSKADDLLRNLATDMRAGNSLQLERVEAVIEDMVDSMVRNPDAMMWVARLRDSDLNTYGHGLNVAINLLALGRHLGFAKADLAQLGTLGLLLDVGKLKLPKELLDKDGRLSSDEFELIKEHVTYSMEILAETANIHPNVLEGVAQHHERMNGSGYPYNLEGKEIGLYGRMAAIADTFSAITKRRPYAQTSSPHEALQMLTKWSGSQFDEAMVEQFIYSIGVFPVGCMVELSTAEIAIVVTHNKTKRLRPKVLVVTDSAKKQLPFPSTLDLLYDVSENPVHIKRGLPAGAYGLDPNDFYVA